MTPSVQVLLLAATISAQPLVNEDLFLEPSVVNEVVHALSVTNGIATATNSACALPPEMTNSLGRTALAIKIVSSQRRDGRWLCGTNDVTAAVRALLKRLLEENPQ